MSARNAALGAVLAVLGLAAAVGIGLAANAISDDSVGLSAQPLSAGDTLAPKTTAEKVKPRPRRRAERGEQTDTSSVDAGGADLSRRPAGRSRRRRRVGRQLGLGLVGVGLGLRLLGIRFVGLQLRLLGLGLLRLGLLRRRRRLTL